MKRYKKANEGIHAPEEAKEKAARSAGKRSRARWAGAAAVLAAVLLAGTAFRPGGWLHRAVTLPYNFTVRTGRATTLAAAQYPEMARRPDIDDYTAPIIRTVDHDKYSEAYDAWQESREALASGLEYAGLMDGFLSASTAQFLVGAGAENRVWSPLNVYMALSMLAETAGGNSRQQLLDLLGAGSIESLRTVANALWRDNYRDDGQTASILANSLWLNDTLGGHYVQDTLNTLARDYYASSFSGEMGSREYDQALRDWINEQTHGLLKDAADGLEMDPNTVLGLASTVYFKAGWAVKFEKKNTWADTFHAPGRDVTVDFMHDSRHQTYYWGDRFSAVSLNFEGYECEMWLILPDEGYSPDDLLTSGEAVEFLLADKTWTYGDDGEDQTSDWMDQKHLLVNIALPKFDVSSGMDLIGGLQSLGVTDIFDYSVSDFTPLADLPDIYVSQLIHAARVTADEEKVEAAAFTFGDPAVAEAPLTDEVDFILDRPFLFAVTGPSGLPLFTGVVNQP